MPDTTPQPSNDISPALPAPPGPPVQSPAPQESIQKHKWHRYFREKYVLIPVLILVLIPIIGILISTRYLTLGLVTKQNYTVEVVDIRTLEPVIGAKLTLRGQAVQTNKFGLAEFSKVKVGNTYLSITKDYYYNLVKKVLVPLTNHHVHVYFVGSSGFELPLNVVNRINKTPVNQAVITYGNAASITNSSGKTVIALPETKTLLAATITAPGYNPTPVLINEATKDVFQMTPTGKIYYLSSSGGSLNLVSANLDGTEPQVILAGTDEQTLSNTSLSHSNDWKYLALFTTRVNSTPSIYLFDTSDNKMSTLDQDTMGFDDYGWTPNDSLVYQYINTTLGAGQSNGSKLKSYDAGSGKSYVLDTNDELGFDSLAYSSETVTGANILANGTILYTKSWTAANEGLLSGSDTTFNSVKPDGSSKQILESLDPVKYPTPPKVVFTSPTSVNVAFAGSSAATMYYVYSGGKISQSTSPSVIATFNNPPTGSLYYLSPTGDSTLWSTATAGNTTLNVGDSEANNPNAVAVLSSSFSPLGWYTEDYLLVSQSGNQMYILPSSGADNQANILRITSYQ